MIATVFLLPVTVKVRLLVKPIFIKLGATQATRERCEDFLYEGNMPTSANTAKENGPEWININNMIYPSLDQGSGFTGNSHCSLCFSSKAEHYLSINILLCYVWFRYLYVPLSNLRLYWVCVYLAPTAVRCVISLHLPREETKWREIKNPVLTTLYCLPCGVPDWEIILLQSEKLFHRVNPIRQRLGAMIRPGSLSMWEARVGLPVTRAGFSSAHGMQALGRNPISTSISGSSVCFFPCLLGRRL